MANLLQKASIVLTPTAYDNGKVLCAKPSEPPYGDFDFSRNSAATRVNAQGLVENVQILSSNLVQNGDFSEEGVQEVSNGSFSQEGVELITNGNFSNGFTNWGTYGNISVSNGVATIGASGNAGIYQAILNQNKSYKVTINVTAYDGVGQAQVVNDLGQVLYSITEVGEQIFYFNHSITNLNLIIRGLSNALFSIDNVSVREVGQNWTLGTGWSIGEDKAVATSGSASKLQQSISGLSGKTCKVSFTLSDYGGSGLALLDFGSTSGQSITANGTYTEIGTYDQNYFQIFKDTNFTGSVTNISVKEVGQNWTLGTGFSIGNNKAILTNGTDSTYQIFQGISGLNTKRLKVTFDISNFSGSAEIRYPLRHNITANGSYSFEGIGDFDRLQFQAKSGATTSFDITNISVIEITDDTNLPRINYEGFSYQDALGSELVVNGDFATDSNWSKGGNWSIGGGLATANGNSNGNIAQSIPLTIGATYSVTYTVVNASVGTRIGISTDAISIQIQRTENGTYTETFIASLTSFYIRALWNNGNPASIDNVSVKEYLGQEVVPDSGCGSWLWEPQSTNLVTNSSGGIYGSNPASEILTTSPDGTNTAVIPVPNATSNRYQYTISGGTYATNSKVTYSWYRKRISTPVDTQYTGDLRLYVLVNCTQVGNTTQIGTNINGFDRFEAVFNITDGSQDTIIRGYFGFSIGVGNSSVAYWGHQVEALSYATSYIPTSGSTVTRNQDVCNNGGSLASINSTEGVLYAEIAALADDGTFRLLGFSDGTNTNRVYIGYSSANIITCRFQIASSVVYGFDFTTDIKVNLKLALKYKENDFALWVNGVKVNSQSSGNTFPIGTLTQMQFASATTSSPFYGKTKALAVWKEALSDQELADLTYPTPTDPTFALNFDTIATDFTFARGSEATYVDAQGLIQSTASNNAPRLDYSTGAEAFLLEPQSTNLVTYSEDFSGSSWNAYGGETTRTFDSSVVNPTGGLGAYVIEGASSLRRFGIGQAVTPSTDYALSFYVKNIDATLLKVNLGNSSVSTYIYTSQVNTTDWSRVEVKFTSLTGTTCFIQIVRDITIGQSVYIWGAQVEALSYATSYIPTSGSTVTRNQETCINATPEINSEEGVLYFEGSALANDGTTRIISLNDGTTANRVNLFFDTTNTLRAFITGVPSIATTAVITDNNKVALKFKSGDISVWLNGTEVATSTSAISLSGLSNLSFNQVGGSNLFGNTKDVQVYTKALSDAELIKLTT